MAVGATEVKELRNVTGAGVLDCKKALEATNGDFDKAVEYLREKGLDAATKKATREANEGMVSILVDNDARVGGIVEVNCETDFVARTGDFSSFVNALTRQVMQTPYPPTAPQMLEQPFIEDPSVTVGERITQLIAGLGENIVLRRFGRIERDQSGLIEGYVHPGNRIGVLVYVSVENGDVAKSPAYADLVHDLALQVAAGAPRFVAPDDVPEPTREAEEAKYRAELAEANKPDHIKDRIISGKLDKWYEEVCLLRQPFVKDGSVTIEQLLAHKSKELGATPTVEQFIRYELGTSE